MQQVTARLERTQQRLASGKRMATAADDPAGLAMARRLEAAVRGMAQGERNLGDGQSLARTAEGALQGTQDNLARMRELTVQAQNGTLTAVDRQAIQQEYDQLAGQIDQTAGGTSFAGRALLDGSAAGANAVVVTDGNGGEQRLDVPDTRAQALGVAGRAVGDPATLQALDEASSRVSSVRATLGAADNRLSAQATQLAETRANAEEARSRIEDADFARELSEQTRDRILLGMQLAGHRVAGRRARAVLDLLG